MDQGRWNIPLLDIFNEVRTTFRLFAPRFLFDSLPQYSLSIFRGYWGKLSNYLIGQGQFSVNRKKTSGQFTKYSHLVGKPVFASKRGTYDRDGPGFKGDATGSDKSVAFRLPCNPALDWVAVFG